MTKGLKHLFLPPEFLGHIVGEKSAMTWQEFGGGRGKRDIFR